MKIAIVLGTNEPETAWNAFRLANTALKSGHKASVFLMNKGVEVVEGAKGKKYDVVGQMAEFSKNKGKLLACGTCLKSRNKEGSATCPVSTMKELLALIEESNRVLTFG